MNKTLIIILALTAVTTAGLAQNDFTSINEDGEITMPGQTRNKTDSLGNRHKEIPKGLWVWTIDERFGDRLAAVPDTMHHMYMNSVFNTGLRGEYNSLGNLGAPRQNRIFADRNEQEQFIFMLPYDYFFKQPLQFHFTRTLSPITNVSFNSAGDRTDGEDHIKALFAVNAGKELGIGFKLDYLYGRGYYQNQSASHINYTMYGSYIGERYQAHVLLSTNHEKVAENGGITDDRYITNPEIFDDNFLTNEIPTVLSKNWNRNDNQHVFLSHRYNIGFSRKVPMTEEEIKAKKFAMASKKENEAEKEKEKQRKKAKREGRDFNEDEYDNNETFSGRPDNAKIVGKQPKDSINVNHSERIKITSKAVADSLIAIEKKKEEENKWLKNEYVPVTSFIHTMKFDKFRRIFQSYETPKDYYAEDHYGTELAQGDSIYDKTNHYELKNTFAIALLEGFNKWAKAGLKAFATSDLRHFTLPDDKGGITTYNEHTLSIGGQLSKTSGRAFHYDVTAETWLVGEDAGQMKIDATADVNFALLGDTVRLAANAYIHRLNPTFYYRHYHSRRHWWDNDNMAKEIRTRIEGRFTLKKTRTMLRVAAETIKNHTYLGQKYNITDKFLRTGNSIAVRQHGGNISLLTAQLAQDFRLGLLNWETVLTYQKSSNADVLPVPTLNLYTNLYLKFKIAKVLSCELGADMRYFTKYYAPDYSPSMGQFTIQENGGQRVQTGNYPIINVYANMHLKHTRFFVMMSHVNAGSGNRNYFLTPHYPLNERVLRLGLSWNFFN
ncbi:putative porin [Prevotella sp. OH937_COT-195]|uniref:putative porin n=1 Tax=Prevotella sp. OH937_COT-195 TaxID=2491051 RepID=UPI000F64F081|nr:putative porin [Prevotella sp. OH937_COT-195]RRD02051.1 hypothetical protein EII32_05025 [Prevotella sp. OH937_COT-195]